MSPTPARRPRLLLLTLGGTIASVPDAAGAGARPTLGPEALTRAVPGVEALADLTPVAFRQLPSAHLTLEDLTALAAEIRARFAEGFEAAVVTQGTDTLEETAFALDLLVDDARPVIVTGAMRGPATPGADGGANLLAAVRVATAEAARGLGCLVVMNDEIHAARWVRKAHTASPSAFASPAVGPIGWVAENAVRIALRPAGRAPLPPLTRASGDVALLATFVGDDGRLVDRVGEAGFQGLVVEAFGGGHVPPAVADAVQRLAGGMPVVVASRSGAGETLAATYGYVGSEIDLAGRGAILAGWLSGPKARLLLALLMGAGIATPAAVAAEFDRRRTLI